MKKIRLIVVVAAMTICVLSGCAMFNDKVKYSGECGGEGDGTNLRWTLTKSGILTISGKGKMTDGELPWNTFYGKLHEKVKKVVLEDGITHIGSKAFYSCNKIEDEVIMPDTVKTVGDFAFYECSGIERIELSPNLERVGNYAFRGCKGWKGDVDLLENVVFIGEEAFENCENLTGELHFSENLTEIGRCAFAHCNGLTGNLVLPDSLEMLGDYAFSGCENLNGRLKLSSKLTAIEMDTFSYTGLTGDLVIPDSVTKIDRKAFYSTNFKEIIFGDSIEFIGSDAFAYNSSLSGVLSFPATLKYIGTEAFARCPNIRGIELRDGIEVIADRAFLGIEQAGTTVELPESIWYAGKGDAAFQDSCFTSIIYKGERESDKEYHVKYRGQINLDVGLSGTGETGASDGASGGSGDVAFVWVPKGENLIGCGKFADTWFNFENDILQICRMYKDEERILADIPVKAVDSDMYIFRTEEAFEYKGLLFQEFQFDRWNYGCETCVAFAKDADGNEIKLLFGDWTDNADGMWDAYQHVDELIKK